MVAAAEREHGDHTPPKTLIAVARTIRLGPLARASVAAAPSGPRNILVPLLAFPLASPAVSRPVGQPNQQSLGGGALQPLVGGRRAGGALATSHRLVRAPRRCSGPWPPARQLSRPVGVPAPIANSRVLLTPHTWSPEARSEEIVSNRRDQKSGWAGPQPLWRRRRRRFSGYLSPPGL